MRILAIETSCDETAIALIDAEGAPSEGGVVFDVLSNIVHSQIELHAEYGGVYPTIAKREHSRNLVPVLREALEQAGLFSKTEQPTPDTGHQILDTILEREPELLAALKEFLSNTDKPDIDAIAVTHGPGLEPALWVGINLARTLATAWDLPLIPINHMEGHFVSALLQAETKNGDTNYRLPVTDYPILALLVSGGHTELVLSKNWLSYELIGSTRDDAAGEAFDKAARVLGLPYPGGPAIAAEAAKIRNPKRHETRNITLPRPMMNTDDFDFSFSGLKTAVRYRAEEVMAASPTGALDEETISAFAYEFQEAVTDVLVAKTLRAAQQYSAKTILLGGGVAANKRLQEVLAEKIQNDIPDSKFYIPNSALTGDNALMIAAAAYLRRNETISPDAVKAQSTLTIA